MRIIVTGAKGMLGATLLPVLQGRHEACGIGRQDCDICDEKAIAAVLRERKPELVVHLAAYTDVDGCETNPETAERTNSLGTKNVALACAELDAAMLYVSTDYVFDGSKPAPYLEDDQPNPLSAYGRSKLHGEQHVRSILKRYFIVRTSWLYGPSGRNFVTTILKLARARKSLRAVDDQRGSPTYTRHLSQTIAALAQTRAYGVYHATGSGRCSRFELAKAILDLQRVEGVEVVPITSRESGRPARRPANSVLANRALPCAGVELLPHWKEGLAACLDEIRNSDAMNIRA